MFKAIKQLFTKKESDIAEVEKEYLALENFNEKMKVSIKQRANEISEYKKNEALTLEVDKLLNDLCVNLDETDHMRTTMKEYLYDYLYTNLEDVYILNEEKNKSNSTTVNETIDAMIEVNLSSIEFAMLKAASIIEEHKERLEEERMKEIGRASCRERV